MSAAEPPPLVREALASAGARGFAQSCSDATGRLLHVLAAQVRAGRIGELGTGAGVGTAWMASALDPATELFTVERDGALASAAAGLFGDLGNVSVVHGDWSELASRAPFWLVFCDAGDPKLGSPDAVVAMLEVGATVVLDDFSGLDHRGDVTRDAWLRHPRLVTTELLVSDREAVVIGVRR